MVTQGGPDSLPAADADVDVVALGEDPGVAAGNRPQLELGEAVETVADELLRDVALECHPEHVLAAEAEHTACRPVDAVGPDEDGRLDRSAGEGHARAVPVHLDVVDLDAVTKLCPRRDSLLDEVVVEAKTLRHVDEGLPAGPLEAGAVAKAEAHAVDDVLDDRIGRDRQVPHRSHRQPAAAGLVAWETRLVDEQHARPCRGQPVGGGRARRPGTDDDRVEMLHRRGS